MNTPFIEVDSQFFPVNCTITILGYISKTLLDCFPLCPYFIEDDFHCFRLWNHFFCDSVWKHSHLAGVANLIFLKWRVLYGIMTKIKTLDRMDVITNPFRKVFVRYLPLVMWNVSILHEFLEILVWNFMFCPEITNDIVDRYITIIIGVQVQEGFPNRYPILSELIF